MSNDNASDIKKDVSDEGVSEFDDGVDRGKEVKCPNCGGNMEFDPQTQTLKCQHCGTAIDIVKNKEVSEINIENAFNQAKQWEKATVVRCENCGAKVVIDGDEVATICPYCGTSQIKKTDEIVGLLPNAIFPFSKTVEEAELSAKKWAKSRFFAPRNFKKSVEAKNLHGVFEPGFTFDSSTFSVYEGRIGETRTRTVGSGKNRHVETYTVWRRIRGTYSTNFDDVTIVASSRLDQNKFDKIMPFDNSSMCTYEKHLLAGYQANHYDKNIKNCWEHAKNKMDKSIRSGILGMYHHDVVDYLNVSTTHNNVTYKYVLYPIYRLNYKFKKKEYPISVNGTTGKVFGKTPISPWRVLAVTLLAVGAILLLGWLLSNGNT